MVLNYKSSGVVVSTLKGTRFLRRTLMSLIFTNLPKIIILDFSKVFLSFITIKEKSCTPRIENEAIFQ